MMRLSGSVKLRCALGLGSSDWRRRRFARLSCGLRLGAAVPFQLRSTLFLRRLLGLGPQCGHRCWIFASRFCLSPVQSGSSSPRLSCRKSRPLRNPQASAAASMRATSAFNSASRFFMRHNSSLCVSTHSPLIFVPSSATWPSLTSPGRLAQLQNLQEQRTEAPSMPLAEVADGSEVRRIQRHNHHKSFRSRHAFASAATNTAHSHSRAAEAPPSSRSNGAAQARSHSCP